MRRGRDQEAHKDDHGGHSEKAAAYKSEREASGEARLPHLELGFMAPDSEN